MKPLTPEQERQLLAQRKAGIHRLWQFDWPAPFNTEFYSQYVFSPDPSVSVIPSVLSNPEIPRSHTLGLLDLIDAPTTSVRFDNDPSDPQRIQRLLGRLPSVTGVKVTIYEMFEPQTGSLSSADWMMLGVWRIANYSEPTTTVLFELKPFFTSRSSLDYGQTVNFDDFPTSPGSSLNEVIPFIAGTIPQAPCLVVESGARSSLVGVLSDSATIIPVLDASIYPTAGSAVIDIEDISWTAVDLGANTLGTAGTPATRGSAPVAHDSGTQVRELLTRYRCIAAYHHVTSLDTVTVQDVPYAPSDYTVTETTLNGHDITYLDLDFLPVLGSGEGLRYILSLIHI